VDSLALDTSAGKLYFTTINETATEGSVLRANLDGSGLEELQLGEFVPGGITVLAGPTAPCVGDLNGDKKVGQEDLGILLGAYGTCPGQPGYNAAAGTLGGNACVTQEDLGLLLSNYGTTCP
jgi:hypothetical protein